MKPKAMAKEEMDSECFAKPELKMNGHSIQYHQKRVCICQDDYCNVHTDEDHAQVWAQLSSIYFSMVKELWVLLFKSIPFLQSDCLQHI